MKLATLALILAAVLPASSATVPQEESLVVDTCRISAPFNASNASVGINSMAAAAACAKQYYEQHIKLEGVQMCDHYVGVYYGLPHSGFHTANEHWRATPPSYKLSGWTPGALAFWTDSGPKAAGHVAIGDVKLGELYSTDYPRPLYVGHGSRAAISSWLGPGYTFQGWYKPYFTA